MIRTAPDPPVAAVVPRAVPATGVGGLFPAVSRLQLLRVDKGPALARLGDEARVTVAGLGHRGRGSRVDLGSAGRQRTPAPPHKLGVRCGSDAGVKCKSCGRNIEEGFHRAEYIGGLRVVICPDLDAAKGADGRKPSEARG